MGVWPFGPSGHDLAYARAMTQTFVVAVEIPDVLPAVVADDVDDSNGVERSHEDLEPVSFTINQRQTSHSLPNFVVNSVVIIK